MTAEPVLEHRMYSKSFPRLSRTDGERDYLVTSALSDTRLSLICEGRGSHADFTSDYKKCLIWKLGTVPLQLEPSRGPSLSSSEGTLGDPSRLSC